MLKGGPVRLIGIEGSSIRPPENHDLPKLKMLAYGTSITQGAAATAPHLTYVSQTARRLGADVINLGSGGSAHCEPAIADYIAKRTDWNICVLCLSVNMIGASFSVKEFTDRTNYMINKIARESAQRHVFCISILPHFRDFAQEAIANPDNHLPNQFRRSLERTVKAQQNDNVHFIEGTDLMPHLDGLSVDLIHPGDYGMIEIAENLANKIRNILDWTAPVISHKGVLGQYTRLTKPALEGGSSLS